MAPSNGIVYLVGSGPGDPGLITVRGCHCLSRADVVLYDYLVNPQILSYARDDARLVCLGRHGRGRILPQDEINPQSLPLARTGQTVVRLKAGDPASFARAAEEYAAFEYARILDETVSCNRLPLACCVYTGIPL